MNTGATVPGLSPEASCAEPHLYPTLPEAGHLQAWPAKASVGADVHLALGVPRGDLRSGSALLHTLPRGFLMVPGLLV